MESNRDENALDTVDGVDEPTDVWGADLDVEPTDVWGADLDVEPTDVWGTDTDIKPGVYYLNEKEAL
jgi:hypothetical protein